MVFEGSGVVGVALVGREEVLGEPCLRTLEVERARGRGFPGREVVQQLAAPEMVSLGGLEARVVVWGRVG